MSKHNYFVRLGGALSRALNVMIFNGHPAETTSARAYRLTKSRPNRLTPRVIYRIINGIFWWQTDHCRQAFLDDIAWAKSRLTNYQPMVKEARK